MGVCMPGLLADCFFLQIGFLGLRYVLSSRIEESQKHSGETLLYYRRTRIGASFLRVRCPYCKAPELRAKRLRKTKLRTTHHHHQCYDREGGGYEVVGPLFAVGARGDCRVGLPVFPSVLEFSCCIQIFGVFYSTRGNGVSYAVPKHIFSIILVRDVQSSTVRAAAQIHAVEMGVLLHHSSQRHTDQGYPGEGGTPEFRLPGLSYHTIHIIPYISYHTRASDSIPSRTRNTFGDYFFVAACSSPSLSVKISRECFLVYSDYERNPATARTRGVSLSRE